MFRRQRTDDYLCAHPLPSLSEDDVNILVERLNFSPARKLEIENLKFDDRYREIVRCMTENLTPEIVDSHRRLCADCGLVDWHEYFDRLDRSCFQPTRILLFYM